ncbi:MAG TPA: RsmB/NOP family class I SAM-dependent RNA methyltransferase, partial [Clostridiales bacterium]|nr:RsmB/NOP family class I SAM-dependent RNA methyltransferase [Clostridiales bacterium]
MLPEEYLDRMRKLLKEEYDAFCRSYAEEKAQGLRINTLKVSVDDFMKFNPFHLEKVPWAEEGFYYTSDAVGKHPYHEAGLYYVQEPSAMAAAVLLDPQPGERILDICAAPGGKATHIAARLQGRGLLVANEIQTSRAKVLSENMERMGVRNAIVTNESPERLSGYFPNY